MGRDKERKKKQEQESGLEKISAWLCKSLTLQASQNKRL